MKKLLFVVAVLLFSTMVNAQEIRFGVKGGLNIGSYDWTFEGESDHSANKMSFYVGGRAEYGLSEKMSIQGELLYQSYGGEYEDGTYSDDLTITELSVPVVLKYYIIPQKFSLNAGLSAGYILSADIDYTDTDYSGSEDLLKEEEGYAIFKRVNIGATLGAEYRVTDNVFVDLRYNFGLSNLLTDEYLDGDDEKFTCTVLQIGVGYRF